jgi:hypothetical protein
MILLGKQRKNRITRLRCLWELFKAIDHADDPVSVNRPALYGLEMVHKFPCDNPRAAVPLPFA